ncbi:hypothetical protein ACOME3_003606 [Neoechinorhynchus agilis]
MPYLLLLFFLFCSEIRIYKTQGPLREILSESHRLLLVGKGKQNTRTSSSFYKVGIPVKVVERWNVINPVDIRCRGPVQVEQTESDFTSIGYIYNGDLSLNTEEVDIYEKLQVRTSCFTNLFGSVNIEKALTPMELRVEELKGKLGTAFFQEHLTYPAPVCSWLRTVNQVDTVYLRQSRQWPFEYRRNVLRSPYLLNDMCGQEYCETKQKHALVHRTNHRKRCDDFVKVNISVFLGSIMINDGILNLPFSQSCCIDFCGHRGPLTDYGTFIALEDSDLANHYCRTRCDDSAGLNADLANKVVLNTFVYFEELSRYTNCMQSRDLMILTNKTTPNGIGNLVPSYHSRLDYAYRVKDSLLYRAMVQYAPFSQIVENENKLCVEDRSSNYLYCYNRSTFLFDRLVFPSDLGRYQLNPDDQLELINGLYMGPSGRITIPHSWQRMPVKEAFGTFVNIKWVEHYRDQSGGETIFSDGKESGAIISKAEAMWSDWSVAEDVWNTWIKYPFISVILAGFSLMILQVCLKCTCLMKRNSIATYQEPISIQL